MKHSVLLLSLGVASLVLVLMGIPPAWAADDKKPDTESPTFAFSLVDGSKLVCRLKIAAIPVTASFGKVDVPLDKIAKIAFNRKDNTISIRFSNGDQLQGTAATESIAIKTSFGDYTIALTNAVEIACVAGGAEAPKVFEDSPEKRTQCINNLRMIDSAKEQWALATRAGDTAEPDPAGVSEYLKGGRVPTCPAGGTYKLNKMNADPTCNVPGHQLPK